MGINIEIVGRVHRNIAELSEKVARLSLSFLGQPDMLDVTINFVSKHEIKRLNRLNRNIDKVTDVLSFPATNTCAGEIVDIERQENKVLLTDEGNIHLGDIAICLSRAQEQAKEYATTLEAEIKKLIIHSILHLLGYDHIKDAEYKQMKVKEEELDRKIEI